MFLIRTEGARSARFMALEIEHRVLEVPPRVGGTIAGLPWAWAEGLRGELQDAGPLLLDPEGLAPGDVAVLVATLAPAIAWLEGGALWARRPDGSVARWAPVGASAEPSSPEADSTSVRSPPAQPAAAESGATARDGSDEAAAPGPVPAAPRQQSPRDKAVFDIERLASYDDTLPAQLERKMAQVVAMHPDAATDVERARRRGERTLMMLRDGKDRLRNCPTREEADAIIRDVPKKYVRDRLWQDWEYHHGRKRPIEVTSTVEARGDHHFLAQPPAAAWKLLVDETGDRFSADTGSEAPGGKEGRLVVIALPHDTPLGPLDLHATDEDGASRDAALQALLDVPSGIFGLTVQALPALPDAAWEDAVCEVLSVAMRLLPLPPGEESVEVRAVVERRGVVEAGADWDLVARNLLREIAAGDPERARRLRLTVLVVAKGGDPHLAYADVVANTWGARKGVGRKRLRQSKLQGRCLLEGARVGERLRRAFAAVGPGRDPDAATWWWLVTHENSWTEEGFREDTVFGAILARVARGLPERPVVWHGYLDALVRELDTLQPDLPAAERAARWLEVHAPRGVTFPPRVELARKLATFIVGNHRGVVDLAAARELHDLATAILPEHAPLACLADLHVAVRHTNAFDFTGASRVLARWKEGDPRLAGMRLHGRVLSSLGQHAAFLGNLPLARGYFEGALATFATLGDARERAREIPQTRAYLAIAATDDRTVGDAEARELVFAAAEIETPAELAQLVRGGEPERYRLHTLLRWVVARPDPEVVEAVLESGPEWAREDTHPWHAIELYRAVLLHRAVGRFERALPESEQAAVWARDSGEVSGGTLKVLGAVFGLAAERLGVPFPDRAERLARAREAVPLAAPWLDAAERAAAEGETAEEILAAGLAFNFR